MEEVWMDIKKFDGQYQVSNLGRIKSIKSNIIMKQNLKRTGYLNIKLCKNNKEYHLSVHRIVADNFIDNPDNKPQVNHINKIKSDNRLINLEWVTMNENMIHSSLTQKKGIKLNNKDYIIDQLDNEVWKRIKGHDMYEISNMGRVKSFKLKYPYLMKIKVKEYSSITIDNTTYNIHRLVAINFINNLDLNKNIVNHINGDKNDNRLINLEWVTPSQNTKKYIDSDRNKTKSGSDLNYSKINEKDAINIYNMEGRHIDIAKIYNISRQSVCGIKNRRNWKNATKNI
jgi:hypothetical protein